MTLDRREFLKLATLLSSGCATLAGASVTPLRFGVVPYLTARRLATLYEPVRFFFERELGRPVHFSSAPDYAAHLERLRAHQYDLVADSLPLARLAQRELGYVPLARTQVALQPVLAIARNSPVGRLEDLRGKSIVVSDRIAALTVVGLRFLRDNGLQPNKDINVQVAGSHANAIQRILSGEAAAAVVSRTTLKQIEPALASQVKVMLDLPPALSAVVYTASPALAALSSGIAGKLIEFANTDSTGQAFIESLGHQALLPVGREMLQVDPLVVEFYRQFNMAE
jgi:ABC-type phosphate/phosphonate transport system substrate-binding protein